MSASYRIAIAGLGTVGAGVIKTLQNNGPLIAMRAGRAIDVVAVSARDKDKERNVDLSAYEWFDNPLDMAVRDDIDCVIEMIGGHDGVSYDLVRSALEHKKHVITANKALLAHHGYDLAKIAEKNGVALAYEAAVAGGIPIIKTMREGLAANTFKAVYGILNGTCNYILTTMRETGREFDDVLKEAQDCGYAESDPTLDIEGIDAAHKLCLLTSLAFGTKPDFSAIKIQGITNISKTDIAYATEFGYRIKLLGIAREVDGKVMQMLEPCLVPIGSPMGIVEDVYNAVYVEGHAVETPLLTGKGAGEGPTASSVIADIIDLARGNILPTFGIPCDKLKQAEWIDLGETESRYYLRLLVIDQPGVIADISKILKDHNISIEGMVQRARAPGRVVPIVLTLHESRHADVIETVRNIKELDVCVEKPCLMRIEEL